MNAPAYRLVPKYKTRRRMMKGTAVYYVHLFPWLIAPSPFLDHVVRVYAAADAAAAKNK